MDQWKEFDTWQDKVSAWLRELEVKVRDTELKATLKDKQVQLDKLKHLHRDLIDHQGDIDALSDAAQDLVRVSTDTRVISQASQLGTKYQGIYTNVKVGVLVVKIKNFKKSNKLFQDIYWQFNVLRFDYSNILSEKGIKILST